MQAGQFKTASLFGTAEGFGCCCGILLWLRYLQIQERRKERQKVKLRALAVEHIDLTVKPFYINIHQLIFGSFWTTFSVTQSTSINKRGGKNTYQHLFIYFVQRIFIWWDEYFWHENLCLINLSSDESGISSAISSAINIILFNRFTWIILLLHQLFFYLTLQKTLSKAALCCFIWTFCGSLNSKFSKTRNTIFSTNRH